VLSIAGLSLLFVSSLGESDGEDTENVSVVGLNVVLGFNGGLPFSNHRTELISGDIHTVEGSFSGGSFDFIDDELNFSPGEVVRFILKITESGFDDSSLDDFSSNLCSESFGNKGFSEWSSGKRVGSFKVKPFLSRKGIYNLFLSSLFAF